LNFLLIHHLDTFSGLLSVRKILQYNSYRKSQQDATVYQDLLFHAYIRLNVFRATHRPLSGAHNCTSSLWFCIREKLLDVVVAGHCQRSATTTTRYMFSILVFESRVFRR